MVCEWCGRPKGRAEPVNEMQFKEIFFDRKKSDDWQATFHVHHVDYSRIGDERFSDLMICCRECHDNLHAFIDRLVRKGHSRSRVMTKLKYVSVARVLRVHELWKAANV